MIIKRKWAWLGALCAYKVTINDEETFRLPNGSRRTVVALDNRIVNLDVRGHVNAEFKIKDPQDVKLIQLQTKFSDITCKVFYNNDRRVELINKIGGSQKHTGTILCVLLFLFLVYFWLH